MSYKKSLSSGLKKLDAFKIEPSSCMNYRQIDKRTGIETHDRLFGSALGGIMTILISVCMAGFLISSIV